MKRCFVAGTGGFARSCVTRLVAAGWTVVGLYSADGSLDPSGLDSPDFGHVGHGDASAGRSDAAFHVASPDHVQAILTDQAVDVLFSLNNPWIIPSKILDLPGLVTINYHDSPLPRYAGLHATSWALLHGETSHAITFHVVTSLVDGGDIVLQRTVPIEALDTAFTLNARCFETALSAFDELLLGAEPNGVFRTTPQQQAGRSYFGRRDRPDRAGVIDLARAASTTCQLVRALNFGPVANALGLAKLFLGGPDWRNAFVTVTKAGVVSETHSSPLRVSSVPGTILAVGPDEMEVATSSGRLRLAGFTTLDGMPLTVEDVLETSGLGSGACLPTLETTETEEMAALLRRVCTSESFWVERLCSSNTIGSPFELAPEPETTGTASTADPSKDPTGRSIAKSTTPLPAFALALHGERNEGIQPTPHGTRPESLAASLVAAYFVRLADIDPDDATEFVHFGVVASLEHDHLRRAFAPSVPLRVATSMDDSFDVFHGQFARELAAVRRHETYPLDIISRYPQLRGKPSPRYSVVFSQPNEGPELGQTPYQNIDADLIFKFRADGSIAVNHHDRFQPWQVTQLDRGLAAFAREATQHPQRPLSALALIDRALHAEVVEGWNRTEAPIPNRCVHQLFEETAARLPDAPALRFDGRSRTYREVDELSNAVAARLVGAGVARGDVVAISFKRSPEIVVTMLGVMKAGAAYLPIDPTSPPARMRAVLDDAGVAAFITSKVIAERSMGTEEHESEDSTERNPRAQVRIDTIDLNDLPPVTHSELTTLRESGNDGRTQRSEPDDLAYVIYTSGSTGTPKAVEIRHRGLVNHSTAIAANYRLGEGSRLLFSASMSFDVAAEQIFPALFSGAEVVVRPEDLFDSFARFSGFLADEEITALVLPTAFWHEWVRVLDLNGTPPPPSLRTLSVGTEKALAGALESWQRHTAGRVQFFQGYGPTETTITCTMLAHNGGAVDPLRPLSIGRPLPNMTAYVVDRMLMPLPIGVSGELLIGGVGVARGYRNNAAMTAERFIESPFVPGETLYRTGDRARFELSGELVFLGRRDFQVKIRGFRVELGEIEHKLRQHPNVAEAVVVLHDDFGTAELIGYVVCSPAANTADGSEVREFVSHQLPDYMVPRAIICLDHFPKTPNQKVDRRALPLPPRANLTQSAPPRTPLECDLLQLWSDYLDLDGGFGMHDEFFTLGGDSLRCLAMLSEVERRFEKTVTLSVFVGRPTIEFLAELLERETLEAPIVVPVQVGDGGAPLWLVHPVGGHVVYAQVLRRSMDPRQTIFGLQAQGLDGRNGPLLTVEAMADLYLEHIRAEQPEGPYFVAGPSMGGLIALEIAQRLLRGGSEVALLGLLDTFGPGYPRPTSRLRYLADQVKTIRLEADWRCRIQLVRQRWAERHERRDDSPKTPLARPRAGGGTGNRVSPTMQAYIDSVTTANEWATAQYRPARYPGRIHLLRAEVTMDWSGMRFDAFLNGWQPIADGGVECLTLPCSHFELVDSPPPAVGQALQQAIDLSREQLPSSERPGRTV